MNNRWCCTGEGNYNYHTRILDTDINKKMNQNLQGITTINTIKFSRKTGLCIDKNGTTQNTRSNLQQKWLKMEKMY